MTHVAADSLGDVNTVIKEDEVGELIDPRPLQRLTRSIAGAHGLEQGGVGPDLRVAVHARLGGRNSCETRGLNRGVAVPAIDAKSGHMMLVTERNWLGLAHSFIGDVWGALDGVPYPNQSCHDEDGAENSGAGQRIRAAMKDLRHSLMRSG